MSADAPHERARRWADPIDAPSASDVRPARLHNREPPRRIEHMIASLEECDSDNQAFDIDNDRYLCEHVLNVPITITSARKRPSDYHHGYFAQVAFQAADDSRGQFSIGGNAAWFPLQQQRFGKLPVRAILRTETSRNGQLYRWECL